MIDLYFWTTPNGMKPLILLEETRLEHTVFPVNISRGEQFAEAFTRISPTRRSRPLSTVFPRMVRTPSRCSNRARSCSTWRRRPGDSLPNRQPGAPR